MLQELLEQRVLLQKELPELLEQRVLSEELLLDGANIAAAFTFEITVRQRVPRWQVLTWMAR